MEAQALCNSAGLASRCCRRRARAYIISLAHISLPLAYAPSRVGCFAGFARDARAAPRVTTRTRASRACTRI